jgi:hypothetical protein
MTITDPYSWNTDVAGHAWVWHQMRSDDLAVVSFTTSYSELIELGAFRHGFQRRPLLDHAMLIERWPRLQEISFDVPFRTDQERLKITPVERHLPWDVYAHNLGLQADEFRLRAERGEFGTPASDDVHDEDINAERPWWNSTTASL